MRVVSRQTVGAHSGDVESVIGVYVDQAVRRSYEKGSTLRLRDVASARGTAAKRDAFRVPWKSRLRKGREAAPRTELLFLPRRNRAAIGTAPRLTPECPARRRLRPRD